MAEIKKRIDFLLNVGIDYLNLNRPAKTLSGGEAQRIRLATQIGSLLTGILYILDEPTTGLHFHDINKLLKAFEALINNGHSLIVIEHDPDVIKTADWIIDLGPEGGDEGGCVVCTGTPETVAQCPESYTGQYLKKIV